MDHTISFFTLITTSTFACVADSHSMKYYKHLGHLFISNRNVAKFIKFYQQNNGSFQFHAGMKSLPYDVEKYRMKTSMKMHTIYSTLAYNKME